MMIKSIDILNLINLFTKKQKIIFSVFIILSFILMGLEILGIYLLVPLMQMLTESNLTNEASLVIRNLKLFPNPILNLVSIIFIVYTVKNFYAITLEYYKFKFSVNLNAKLSQKLFSNYINESIIFHLNNNSSKLVRNIQDVGVIINLTKGIMLLITEIMVVLGLTCFLFYFETKVAVAAILFLGIVSTTFYKTIQNKVSKAGKVKQKNDSLRIMHMLQGLRGIKDIKILNKEKFFIDKFSFHNKLSSFSEFTHNFLLSLPKLIIEWLLILAIIIFIGFVILEEKNYSYLITTLGIFLAAAFRLLPSVARLINAIQGINFYRPVVNTLKDEILSLNTSTYTKSNKPTQIFFEKTIVLNNLFFKFKDKDKFILNDINLEIRKKEKIGIFGESGSGKTTLINILLGLIKPNSGDILVDGRSIFDNLNHWHSKIGYVSQFTYLSDESIRKNIAFGVEEDLIDNQRLNNCIKNAGLEKFILKQKNGLNTTVGELGEKISGGEKQRIGIARSLYINPSVLILDEFTSALDNETEQKILNEIFDKSTDTTIFLVSHRESALNRCNRVFQLQNTNLKQI